VNSLLQWFSQLVTARPKVTLIVLAFLTVVMVAGIGQREPSIDGTTVGLVPVDHPVRLAIEELDELFDESDAALTTVLFRGQAGLPEGLAELEVRSPEAFAQMDALTDAILADQELARLLARTDPIISPSLVAAGINSVAATSEDLGSSNNLDQIEAVLDSLTGIDESGTPVAVVIVRLNNTDEEVVQSAERKIDDLAAFSEGPLRVSSVSLTVIEDEYRRATEEGVAPLIGLALLLIAGLILLFMRTGTDLMLTVVGLVLSLIWVLGVEGWLGPSGLSFIGPPSAVSASVPIILISLTVDYSIQILSHYREKRVEGEPVLEAVRNGLSTVGVPIALAALTTMGSFLSILFSPVDPIGDFGVVTALGVGLSFLIMMSLIPAGRTIIDQRREARGTLKEPRLVSGALPGIERAAEVVGTAVSRRPAPYLIVVLAITALFGFSAAGLESGFAIRDILPRDGSVTKDLETLDAAVGGSTEQARILIKAEATEARTLLNIRDLTNSFADEQQRPQSAVGPLEPTYVDLVADAPAEVQLNPALMQDLLNNIEIANPDLRSILVNNPDGEDAILLRFSSLNDDPTNAVLQQEIEELWDGDDGAITVTSESVLASAINELITDGQTESISTTVLVATTILAIFFWATLRRPMLSVLAVGPIVLVLIWVMGTMALLGISYSLLTANIVALSVGIGVDYTIHIIHRYREEFARVRKPETAAIRALSASGSALLASAMTTAFGFGVLILAPLDGFRQFGIVAAISIGYSLLVAVLVVPPAMTIWGAYENMRLRSTVQRLWDDIDVAADEIYQRNEQTR